MVLSSALNNALSGLQYNNFALATLAGNVGKAGDSDYNRRVATPVEIANGGVNRPVATRMYSGILHRQIAMATANRGYFDAIASFAARIDGLFGTPGTDNTLDQYVNQFSASLKALATDPSATSLRTKAITRAGMLSDKLNYLATNASELQAESRAAIASEVTNINDLLQELTKVNKQLFRSGSNSDAINNLKDRRDSLIERLSASVAIKFSFDDYGIVKVRTETGVTLLDQQPAKLAINGDDDSITMVTNNGQKIDLLRHQTISRGRLAGLVEINNNILPRLQKQLDEIAAGLALAMSASQNLDEVVDGQSGLAVDVDGLAAGNAITIDYLYKGDGVSAGKRLRLIFIKTDDPAAAGEVVESRAKTDDVKRYMIDFSGGVDSAIKQINNHIKSHDLTASLLAGKKIAITGGDKAQVTGVSAPASISDLSDGNPLLPLFIDGTQPFAGSDKSGLAARITVNPAVLADPSLLVRYSTSPPTAAGDNTRPQKLVDQLMNFKNIPDYETGLDVGGSGVTVMEMIAETIAYQADFRQTNDSDLAFSDQFRQLIARDYQEIRGVDIDQEMAALLTIQRHYAANARVLKVANDMIELLMRM